MRIKIKKLTRFYVIIHALMLSFFVSAQGNRTHHVFAIDNSTTMREGYPNATGRGIRADALVMLDNAIENVKLYDTITIYIFSESLDLFSTGDIKSAADKRRIRNAIRGIMATGQLTCIENALTNLFEKYPENDASKCKFYLATDFVNDCGGVTTPPPGSFDLVKPIIENKAHISYEDSIHCFYKISYLQIDPQSNPQPGGPPEPSPGNKTGIIFISAALLLLLLFFLSRYYLWRNKNAFNSGVLTELLPNPQRKHFLKGKFFFDLNNVEPLPGLNAKIFYKKNTELPIPVRQPCLIFGLQYTIKINGKEKFRLVWLIDGDIISVSDNKTKKILIKLIDN